MSGIEVTGLLLGAIPVLVEAMSSYAAGCRKIKDWLKYSLRLQKLVEKAMLQEILLRQNLEKLFGAVLDSEDDAGDFCADLSGSLEQHPAIKQRAAKHLDEAYLPFVQTVMRMRETIAELADNFGVVNGQIQHFEKSDLKAQYKRIKFTLKKDHLLELLEELDKNNRQLGTLLKNVADLAPVRRRRATSKMSGTLTKIRESAISMYKALRCCWTCQCREPHAAGLALVQQQLDSAGLVVFDVCLSSNKSLWFETLIKSSAAAQSSQPLQQLAVHSGKVRFADSVSVINLVQGVTTPAGPPDEQLISDLCKAMNGRFQKQMMGYIMSNEGHRHFVEPKEHEPMHQDYRPLESLIKGLTRARRMRLAVQCAESLLRLYETPWVGQGFNSSRIVFLPQQSKSLEASQQQYIDTQKPIVLAEFASDPKQKAPQTATLHAGTDEGTREALLELGIILLELSYGQLLSEQPMLDEFLGPGGKPTRFTRRNMAGEWRRGVLEDAGREYDEVVARCLDCNFGLGKINLDSAEFRQTVYDYVVVPLQGVADQFPLRS